VAISLLDAGGAHSLAIHSIYGHWVRHGLASFEEEAPDQGEMDHRRRMIQDAGFPYILAEESAIILGFAYAGPYRTRSAYRYTVEDSVYVAPEALGRGVGRALLSRVISRAEIMGKRQMVAIIGDPANAPSIRLHESLGFRRIGTLQAVGYKFGRWVDTVFMQRTLGPGDSKPPLF
jgi:L-amino acid N-acyltransferase YncA